jgi:hypothetical protein
MPTQFAIEKAAQVWCQESTKNKVMDTVLAMEFAVVLDREVERMKNTAEFFWTVVANVSGGDWEKQTPEWETAAAKARDDYHELCTEMNRKTA